MNKTTREALHFITLPYSDVNIFQKEKRQGIIGHGSSDVNN